MRTEALTGFGLGLRVHDVDPDAPDQATEIQQLIYEHAVVLIRGVFTGIDNNGYADFARKFGTPGTVLPTQRRADGHPNVERLTVTTDKDNTGWHQDLVEVAGQSPVTFMLCDEAPTRNGETLLADTRAAIDGMPADLQRELEGHAGYYPMLDSIENLRETGVLSSKGWSEADLAKRMAHLRNFTMPLVTRHPVSGRRTLVLNEWHMPQVAGMARSDGDELLENVFAAVTDESNVYRHTWQVGDLLIWDNTLTMHTAARVGAGNKLHRRIIVNGPF